MSATVARVLVEILLVARCASVLLNLDKALVREMESVQFRADAGGQRVNISSLVALVELGNNSLTQELLAKCNTARK